MSAGIALILAVLVGIGIYFGLAQREKGWEADRAAWAETTGAQYESLGRDEKDRAWMLKGEAPNAQGQPQAFTISERRKHEPKNNAPYTRFEAELPPPTPLMLLPSALSEGPMATILFKMALGPQGVDAPSELMALQKLSTTAGPYALYASPENEAEAKRVYDAITPLLGDGKLCGSDGPLALIWSSSTLRVHSGSRWCKVDDLTKIRAIGEAAMATSP